MEFLNGSLMDCHVCLGSTDDHYKTYNLAVSGVLLAIVGVIGLVCNILVVATYMHREQRIMSSSIYLAFLGLSDFFLILTAMFLFVLEAWRHHNFVFAARSYVAGAPFIFPIAAIFQTSSVYFCVAAACDCFISVVLDKSVKEKLCTPKRAFITCTCIFIACAMYNIPHWLELQKVDCWDSRRNELSEQICPTSIRMNPQYYTIYYTYLYTSFLAVGPLVLLVLINVCVVYTVVTRPPTGEDSDTISLILVVFFFIFCNFMALSVNFMEVVVNDPNILVYFVDLSNLLVVVNATINFFCYLIFGVAFRRTMKKLFGYRSEEKSRWTGCDTMTLSDGQHAPLALL